MPNNQPLYCSQPRERKVEARYVTLCALLWDPATHQIVMANAGALPPMICRGGEILKIRVEGVPLGLLDSREHEEAAFQAAPGEAIVLYSDGITDHMNAQVVRVHCRKPAGELVAAIFDDLDKFSTTAFDDQTVFVMKVK